MKQASPFEMAPVLLGREPWRFSCSRGRRKSKSKDCKEALLACWRAAPREPQIRKYYRQ
jgi:hypothetical protein